MRLPAFVLAAAMSGPAFAVDLGAAIRAAFEMDPELASAVANRDAATENIAIAQARLRPQVTLQATYQRLDQNTTSGGVTRQYSGPSESAQLTVRQALLRQRDRQGVAIGSRQAEIGELRLESARSALINRATFAWVDVLVSQASREVFARAENSVAEAAKQEARRFEAGDGTRDAVAESAAQLALIRAQLAEARLDAQSKLLAFNQLTKMGAGEFAGYRLPGLDGIVDLREDRAELLERVLGTNPELASARVVEELQKHRLAQASADHMPTIDLVASINRGKSDSANLVGTQYENSQVGVQMIVPIYQGGGVVASERQAAAGVSAASADREALVNQLNVQFMNDWNSQLALRERIVATESLVNAALEQRRAAELGIKAGLRTWADLGAVDLQIARRESDRVGLIGQLLKTQSRLLSLLPVSDPAWERWTGELAGKARP